MRLRTKRLSKNHVRHSYWVSFLRWLSIALNDHVDDIIDKAFDR